VTQETVPAKVDPIAEQLQIAKLYFDRCDFAIAIEKYSELSENFKQQKNWEEYLKCQNFILRMYAEMEEFDKINDLKEKLQDLVLNEGFELSSRTYYTLGLFTFYKEQYPVALDYFQKALQLGFAKDSKEDICHGIFGVGMVYYATNRLSEALKEVYNLKVFFEVLQLPQVKMSTLILNAHILRKLNRHNEALEILWECYSSLREEKNIWMFTSLLYGMALTYDDMGEIDLAKTYLKLAKGFASNGNLRHTSRSIDSKLESLGVRPHNDYDLIFNMKANTVTERKRGTVDFKNQFILLDLLQLFISNPGETFSKESLVERIWKQTYSPSVHDNKIYVTIKRLRQMIEPDEEKPRYIFRAKNGYYMNKNTRVLLEH
jgi:DNA-binding winged helix-turn-helix (wHTH) protein